MSPTAANFFPAPEQLPANAATVAPTPEPTVVLAAELIAGTACLDACEASAPASASSSVCAFYDYALSVCEGFSRCTPQEATTVKDSCLGHGACSNLQCGVAADAALVETPKAAVVTTMTMYGITAEAIRVDLNVQLALTNGVATSVQVEAADVTLLGAQETTSRRRLSTMPQDYGSVQEYGSFEDEEAAAITDGVSVSFEIALEHAHNGTVAAMTEKVAVQATTFGTFAQAAAAELGVLDLWPSFRSTQIPFSLCRR